MPTRLEGRRHGAGSLRAGAVPAGAGVIGLIRLTIDCTGGFLASTGLDLTPFCNLHN